MKFRKFIDYGQEIPKGYGIAFYAQDRPGLTVMPIPFNWIAAWLFRIWRAVKIGPAREYEDKLRREGYQAGCADTNALWLQKEKLHPPERRVN